MAREPVNVNVLPAEDMDDQSRGHGAGSHFPFLQAGALGRPPPRAIRVLLCFAAASAAAGLALEVWWRWGSRGGRPPRALPPQSGDQVGPLVTGDESFSLARQGTWCENGESIGMGEMAVTASANQCARRCRPSAGCMGFNWQGHCEGGDQEAQRGSCILLRSVCTVTENPCWDLYDVGGGSVLEENSEGTVAETTPSSMQTTVTLPAETTADDPEGQTAPGSVQTTFTLPAGTISEDDPEIQAAVLVELEQMLAEETGAAYVSVSLKQEWGGVLAEEIAALPQQERRLNEAAPKQELEATFAPASPKLAALIDEQHDVLKSKICETAAQTVKGVVDDLKVPTTTPENSNSDRNHSDTLRSLATLGFLATLILGGCVAVVYHHEARKKGRESSRESRQVVPPGGDIGADTDEQVMELQLVPPGGDTGADTGEQLVPPGGDIGADTDEQVMELQQAQKLALKGFGHASADPDLVAETDLVQDAAAGATALPVRSTHGFCRGDRVQIISGKGSETKVICGFDDTTGAMLVYTGLFYTHAVPAFVSKRQMSPRSADYTSERVDVRDSDL